MTAMIAFIYMPLREREPSQKYKSKNVKKLIAQQQ